MCLFQKHWCELPLSGVTSPLYAPTAAAPAGPPKAAVRGLEIAVVGSKRQREITLFHWERKREQDLKPNILMVAGGGKTI